MFSDQKGEDGEKKEKAKVRKTEKSAGKEAIRRNLICAFARKSR